MIETVKVWLSTLIMKYRAYCTAHGKIPPHWTWWAKRYWEWGL